MKQIILKTQPTKQFQGVKNCIKCICILTVLIFGFNSLKAQNANAQVLQKSYRKLPLPGLRDTLFHCQVLGDKAYIDGDIYVGDTAYLNRYQNLAFAVVIDGHRWTNSTVPVEIDNHFTVEETNMIITSLNEMMSQTNIVFKFHQPNITEDYIKYTKSELLNSLFEFGGNSSVGKQGGSQDINLRQVTKGVVIHETMHALGFYHEQSREDRETFVDILEQNVDLIYIFQFDQHNFDATDIGRYDITSIMQYRFNAFGRTENGRVLQTIVNRANPADISFGNGNALSNRDIRAVNQIYAFRPTVRTPLPLLTGMRVGERITVRVEANVENNFTDIVVAPGQKYKFTAFSRDRWKNSPFGTSSSADGINDGGCRRETKYKMMKLVGDVFSEKRNNKSTGISFRIGLVRNEFTIPVGVTGFLTFFANDCMGTYFDNSGSIGLHIERTQ